MWEVIRIQLVALAKLVLARGSWVGVIGATSGYLMIKGAPPEMATAIGFLVGVVTVAVLAKIAGEDIGKTIAQAMKDAPPPAPAVTVQTGSDPINVSNPVQPPVPPSIATAGKAIVQAALAEAQAAVAEAQATTAQAQAITAKVQEAAASAEPLVRGLPPPRGEGK